MYNGWSNYPTWSVILIINNTQSLYNWAKRTTEEIVNSSQDETDQMCILADAIESLVSEMKPSTTSDIWSQLMTYVNSEVNYREIAESILNDYKSDAL